MGLADLFSCREKKEEEEEKEKNSSWFLHIMHLTYIIPFKPQ